jgi:translation initiation factor IF-2
MDYINHIWEFSRMSKMRVYELAKELNVGSKEFIARLEKLGIAVKSHSSSLESSDVERIRKEIASGEPVEVEEKRIKTTVIRRRAVRHPVEVEEKITVEIPKAELPKETEEVPVVEKKEKVEVSEVKEKLERKEKPAKEIPAKKVEKKLPAGIPEVTAKKVEKEIEIVKEITVPEVEKPLEEAKGKPSKKRKKPVEVVITEKPVRKKTLVKQFIGKKKTKRWGKERGGRSAGWRIWLKGWVLRRMNL